MARSWMSTGSDRFAREDAGLVASHAIVVQHAAGAGAASIVVGAARVGVRNEATIGRSDSNMNCAETRRTWREEAARRSIDSRWKDAMLMVVAAACFIAPSTASTLIAGRHKTDRECSLQTVEGDDIAPMEYCSFLPGLGENRHKRVLIQFGESNCKFTLRNCVPVSACLFALFQLRD